MNMDLMMTEMMLREYQYVVVEGDPEYDPVNQENNYYWDCIECKIDKNYSHYTGTSCEVCNECYKREQDERNKGKRDEIKKQLKRLPKRNGSFHIIRIRYEKDGAERNEKYLYKYTNGRWRQVCWV